ncbi:hypothetical protein [Streptomyces wuyuanensis]|uniref:hypothetical protein n=1 Tax=Streptomyces wuyuanensis TaxID=1196353 RepID=UPI0037208479
MTPHLNAHVPPFRRCGAPRTAVHTDDSHHPEDLVDASGEYAPDPTGTEARLYREAHRRTACRRAAVFAGRVAVVASVCGVVAGVCGVVIPGGIG